MLQPRSVLVDSMSSFGQCVGRLGIAMLAVFNLSRIRPKASIALILIICSATAVAGTFMVQGPQVFVRAGGQPVTEVVNFNVKDPTAEYTIIVTNGANGGKKVSSGTVLVNGIQILGPSDFGQNVTQVIRPVTLLGANTLSVELRGEPGGAIAIEIIGTDDEAPTITATTEPTPNAAGWNNEDVTVSFDCSDDTSGIQSCPDAIVVSVDGAGQVISGTATDHAGNTATASVTLNIDTTEPAIDFSLAPVVNAQGWHNADTTVSFVCTDALSGISSCSNPISIVTEGANQEATGTAVDVADNTATAVATVSLDKTNPTIVASAEPPANANGWNNSDVTVSFACTDALSGVGFCTAPVSVSAEGENQAVDGSGTDNAGNEIATAISISIDKTVPSLTIVSPAAGSSDSSTTPTVSVAYSDNFQIDVASLVFTANGSPLPVTCQNNPGNSDCTPSAALPEGAITLAASISDNAGNSANAQVSFDISIDADGDGVSDALDQCPGTPNGETVDANGCSPSQLDADGDGVSDALDQCPGTPSGEAVDANGCSPSQLDADGDGVTDDVDQCPNTPAGETVDAQGCSASQQDTQPPALTIASPTDGALVAVARPVIRVTYSDASDVDEESLTVLRNGTRLSAVCVNDQIQGECTLAADLPDGAVTLTVTIADTVGNIAESQVDVFVDSVPVALEITSPINGFITSEELINVTGLADIDILSVKVNDVDATVINGSFSATVALSEGHNMLVAIATKDSGKTGVRSVEVTRDIVAPIVTIDSPRDGFNSVENRIAVTGLVNDIVDGGIVARVLVNGVEATVSDGSFMVVDLPVVRGPNVIEAVATDSVGNQASDSITVNFDAIAGTRITVLSGNGQAEITNQILPQPLAVEVKDDLGNPVAGSVVKFEVTRNSGLIRATALDDGARVLLIPTNGSGQASVLFELGDTVGEGNNRITAKAVGVAGEAEFCASAMASAASDIQMVMGDNQRGIVSQPLPLPLEAMVIDKDGNPIKNLPVNFSVLSGGGNLDGESVISKLTGIDGIARATLTLGADPGINNNLVQASFVGVTTLSATYLSSGIAPGDPEDTKFTGVVLDNSQTPIPGALVTIVNSSAAAVTNADGQFLLDDVPVGRVHLHIDPSGSPRPETFPPLEFETVTIAGQVNILGQPVLLPAVQLQNSKIVGGAEDVTIFMPDVEGMSLTVKAGSAIFPNGDTTGQLSISQVHMDKVPMPPPNGSLFMPPAWTIQPAGVKFDPPAEITIPNDGLPPGRIIDIFQFDHTLNQFINVGKGIVADDGSDIVSDSGFGITRTGWGGCGLPPPPDTCSRGACPNLRPKDECEVAKPAACPKCPFLDAADPAKLRNLQVPNDCLSNTCGGQIPDLTDMPLDDETNCFDTDCLGNDTDDNTEAPNDCQTCNAGSGVNKPNGGTCDDDCGLCVDGTCDIVDKKPLKAAKQLPDDCKTLLCDGTSNARPSEAPACDASDCRQTNTTTCECDEIPNCDCQNEPPRACNFCQTASADNCTCDSNPATDNKIIDACRACAGGVPRLRRDACPATACSMAGSCTMAGGCVADPKPAGVNVNACYECDGAGGTRPIVENGISLCFPGDPDPPEMEPEPEPPPDPCDEDPTQCDQPDRPSGGTIEVFDRNISATTPISDGDTLFITADGVMPLLSASVDYPSATAPESVTWNFSVEHPRRAPGNYGNGVIRVCRDEDVDSRTFNASLDLGTDWDIFATNSFALASNTVGATDFDNPNTPQAVVSATGAQSVSFNIEGKNPTKGDVLTVISALTQLPIPVDRFNQMALHESESYRSCAGDAMMQFNEPGCFTSAHDSNPNFGGPDGWGIFHIDHSITCTDIGNGVTFNSDPVNTSLLWNWRLNLGEAHNVIRSKYTEAEFFLNQIRRHNTNNFPTQWEEPPDPIPGFTDAQGSPVTISSDAACGMQAYNGRQNTNPQTGEDSSGNLTSVSYCMEFDRNASAGNKWTFLPNGRNYVKQVVSR